MERPRRTHPRLKQYDYSQAGLYFVTTNVYHNRYRLSRIPVGRGLAPAKPTLTPAGQIVRDEILAIAQHYPSVSVDKYVIMPNHVHLLLSFHESAAGASPRPTLMQVIGAFKSLSARQVNRTQGTAGEPLWQTSFYVSVLQSEAAYQDAWNYIHTNPARWAEDPYFVR